MPLTLLDSREFAALMAPLGPFEPAPHLAVAVSGGADSMALAWLARAWAAERGGRATALVVDHGLRAESAAEAAATLARLAGMGLATEAIVLHGLAHGPGLAERARAARHAALSDAAMRLGALHLLFGHHAADQAETVAMRLLAGSGAAGLAGMAALVETAALRMLRPLLDVGPGRLRATLAAAAVAWVEDPSRRRVDHEQVDGLVGESPSPIDLPAGCFLAGRCARAEAACQAERQDLRVLADGRGLRCGRAVALPRQDAA